MAAGSEKRRQRGKQKGNKMEDRETDGKRMVREEKWTKGQTD